MTFPQKMALIVFGGIIAIAGLIAGLVASYGMLAYGAPAIRDENNIPAVFGSSCDSASVAVVPVGHQLATVAQATTTRRALLRIQQPFNATNTLAVAINGVVAVFGQGLLVNATSSTEVGLTTTFPYTGSVSVITNNGSTTILVSTCTY